MRAALLALVLIGSAYAGVEVLDDATFTAGVASGEPYLVKLFAPWCGHCKRLAPVWESLAETVASSPLGAEKKVHIASVDCTVHKDTCAANNVRGYPTLLLFKDGNKEGQAYKGGRDEASLLAYLNEQFP